MAISKAINTLNTAKGSAEGTLSALTLDNFHKNHYLWDKHNFKSLDFSDIAIYGRGNGTNLMANGLSASNNEKFRHFHQMRLFIQKGQTNKHEASDFQQTMITCNLPEQISYSLNSHWQPPLDFGDATFNLLMQIGGETVTGGKIPSGTLRVASLKIWQKTDPLTLDLTIPVIDDNADSSRTNLVEALEILGSLALPRYDSSKWGFYTPPPSPLAVKLTGTKISSDKNKQKEPWSHDLATGNNARIMLQLGGVLLIDNCIIEKVDVQYPNTKAQILHYYDNVPENTPYFGTTGHKYLHPLLAIVKLRISTVEALTANTYSKMLWAKPQSGQGVFTADLTPATEGINSVINAAVGEGEEQQPTEINP